VSQEEQIDSSTWDPDAQKFDLLYSQDKIDRKIRQMGQQISYDYKDKELLLIGVLKGCVVFMADLMRTISIPLEIDFITATSYSNGLKRDDKIVFAGGPEATIKGKHILIVEGIVDTGQTVEALINRLKNQEPASIEIVTLLDKPISRKTEIKIRYKGFDAGKDFVIGYGLDISQKFRNLPFIGKVINE